MTKTTVKLFRRQHDVQLVIALCFIASLGVLTACGGGGSSPSTSVSTQDPGTVSSTNSFAFGTAWKGFLSTGYTKRLSVSGSCGGTLDYLHTAVTQPQSFSFSDTTFPHPPGTVNPGYVVSHQQETKALLTGCATTSSVTTTTAYFDAQTFAPFGYKGGTAYNGATSYKATFREFPDRVVLPSSVKVGDSGTVGTLNIYGTIDFKKDNISQGKIDVTYQVEPDTGSTALINIISKSYSATGTLLFTDQTRYRIDSSNTLTLHSIDQQESGASGIKIVAK